MWWGKRRANPSAHERSAQPRTGKSVAARGEAAGVRETTARAEMAPAMMPAMAPEMTLTNLGRQAAVDCRAGWAAPEAAAARAGG